MNKIVASIGMAAIGATSIQAVSAQDFSAPPAKPWNVSASLRGFYDDNVSTVSTDLPGVPKDKTFGYELSPSVGLNWGNEATKVVAGYRYSFRYYDHRPVNTADKYDQSHNFNLLLDHTINERFRVGVSDNFVVGQEPDRLSGGGAIDNPQHVSGNNIRNFGTIKFDAQITRLFALELGYANTYVDYAADGPLSYSALLDRMEHKANLDARLQLAPSTIGVLGYAYGQVDYMGDEAINFVQVSKDRNNRSHYVYVGVDHTFNPELIGSARGGVQYVDFYNQDETSLSPYVQLSLDYTYAPESHLSVGFTQSRNASSTAGNDATDYVRDSDTSVLYGSIRHRIVPNLFGSVIGTFQNSIFNGGGSFDGQSEKFYQLGLNVEYQFNTYVSAEIGYNYDKVDSDIDGRGYDRNRVYIGVKASY